MFIRMKLLKEEPHKMNENFKSKLNWINELTNIIKKKLYDYNENKSNFIIVLKRGLQK